MTITLTDDNFTYTQDITNIDASDLVEEFVKIMRLMTYHDVSIWRALNNASYSMQERFDSVVITKDEWDI